MSKKNIKKRAVNAISIIIGIVMIVLTLGLFAILINLGILPTKYLIPLIGFIVLMYLGIGKVILSKKLRTWVKVIVDVICIIIILTQLFIYYYLNSTLHFMDKIKAGKYQTDNYYVLVEKNSNVKQLDDIKVLGLYNSNFNEYDEALEKLKEEINFKEESYDNYIDLSESLFDKDVDAILMNSSYKEIVAEMIEDFNNKVEILHTIEIKMESNVEVNEVDVTKEPFNVYVSGIDVYGDISNVSRSDVNMIISINPKNHKILLTSIPRDYYVQLHGTTGSRDKLTHAGMYGVNMSIETLEDLLEIDIDYYVRVNFTTVINLVDAIGGIEIYSDTAFNAWTDRSCFYTVGINQLDGKCALAYSRERFSYIDGDRHRVRNQQDVISAIMKKALSSKTLITKYTNILESMGESFQTNIPNENIYALINKQLNTMSNWNFDTYSLNGFDSSNGTYTFGDQQLYVMEPDMSTVEMAREKIKLVMGK